MERSIEIAIRLRLRAGRMKSAQILLPKRGFSRWYELENGLVSADDDPAFRQTASSWASAKVETLLLEATKGKRVVRLRGYHLEEIQPLELGDNDDHETEVSPAEQDDSLKSNQSSESIKAFSMGPLQIAIFENGAVGVDSGYEGIEIKFTGDTSSDNGRRATDR
jgi:hypothetical protein